MQFSFYDGNMLGNINQYKSIYDWWIFLCMEWHDFDVQRQFEIARLPTLTEVLEHSLIVERA